MSLSSHCAHFFIISTLLCLLCITVTTESGQLRFLFLLVRHGERLPCHTFPHPDYPNHFVTDKCELTRTGSKQHHNLGEYVRHHYSSLLSSNFNQKEVFIRSTGTARTLMSANFFLNGLFASLEDELPWMPPVYSCPKQFDELLKVSCPCPAFKKLLKDSITSELAIEFARRELPLFYKLKEIAGFSFNQDAPHESLPHLWELCDPVFVWHHLAPSTVPLSFTADLISGCHRALGFKQQVHFASPTQTHFKGGPLVLHLLDLLNTNRRRVGGMKAPPTTVNKEFDFVDSALLGTDALDISVPPEARLVAYFSHDSMLAAFLSHLGIFNNILPPFASAVFIELREHADGEMRVHFLYYNESTSSGNQTPHPLVPRVCKAHLPTSDKEGCPLSVFEAGLRGTASTDLTTDCQLSEAAGISSSNYCFTQDTCSRQQQPPTTFH